MIKSITITNNNLNRKIDLMNPETSGYAIAGISGLDPVNSEINTSNTALADGSVFNVSRTGERNILIQMIFQPGYVRLPGIDPQWMTIEDLRYFTYKLFHNKALITLTIQNGKGTYAIDGYVESNSINIFSKMEGSTLSIICPNPYFRDITSVDEKMFTFTGVEPKFEFAFSNESLTEKLIVLGDTKQLSLGNIFYNGTINTGVRVVLNFTGDAKNIRIFNLTTSELLTINHDFVNNDSLEIISVVNSKKITLSQGSIKTNLIGSLDLMSDWINLQPGDNLIGYQADEGESHIEMRVYYNEYCLAI